MSQKRDREQYAKEFELGLVVQEGRTAPYQFPREKTSFVDIHQVWINQINSLPNRRQDSNFVSFKNGGHNKPNNYSFIKRDLGSFVEKGT